MKDPNGKVATSEVSDAPRMMERLSAIAITSAASIVALQGAAFAAADRVLSPRATCIEGHCPMLDPGTAAAAGVTIATLGAYRLARARRQERKPEDQDTKS